VTGGGARLLADWLSAPLTDIAAIAARHDAIEYLTNEVRVREDVREGLKRAPDLERALQRLSLDRGGPRDIAAIRDGLKAAARSRRISPPPASAPRRPCWSRRWSISASMTI
jgi:DNA mismatch repair protein MutS